MTPLEPNSTAESTGPSECAPAPAPAHRPGYGRTAAALLAAGVPAFVLVLAGLAKLRDPFLAGIFIHYTLNMSLPTALLMARVLAGAELIVGTAVLLLAGRSAVPALAGVGLYALFVGLLLRLLMTQRSAATCGCFGDLWTGPGQRHLRLQCTLDVIMATLLVIHLLLARRGSAPAQRAEPDEHAEQR